MKSIREQIEAIEELYRSGSISEEEYREMIHIVKPKVNTQPKPDYDESWSRYKRKVIIKTLAGIVIFIYVIYYLVNILNEQEVTNKEQDIIKQKALSLAKTTCECDLNFNEKYLNDLIDLNNNILKSKYFYRSEALKKYEEITNSKKRKTGLMKIDCFEIDNQLKVFFNNHSRGTLDYNRLDSIYKDLLNKERNNISGRNHKINQYIQKEIKKFERLIKDKIDFENENELNMESLNIKSILNQFFYYYNQVTPEQEFNNEIFNYTNLPINLNGNDNIDVQHLMEIIVKDRSQCLICYYNLGSELPEYKGKEGDKRIWAFKLKYNFENSEFEEYDAIVKIQENKIHFLEFIR